MSSSPQPLAIVTGTSSGIGEALAYSLIGRGWRVVGLARRDAAIRDPHYKHIRVDLADLAAVASALESQVRPLLASHPTATRVGLVNNAALVALLGPVQQLDPLALLEVYAVNTAAPIMLMGWFLRHCPPGVPLRIVNVSTGAAVSPYPGLAAYGNTKAALRLAGMVLAAELDTMPNAAPRDATILSYEPGLVDTPMQTGGAHELANHVTGRAGVHRLGGVRGARGSRHSSWLHRGLPRRGRSPPVAGTAL